MAIERFIENTPVFTRRELMSACGDNQNNSNLLTRAKKSGKVVAVARNVYISDTGRCRANTVSPYLVAQKLDEHTVFSYDTALGLLTGLQDIAFRISFYASHARKNIVWNRTEFISYQRPETLATREHRLTDGTVVTLTNKEQTIVDCMAHPERCGGSESMLRSFSTLEFVDAEALAKIAIGRSKSVAAKTGWLLEQKHDDWNVEDTSITTLHEFIASGGPYYFSKVHEIVEEGWNAKWRLYFPSTVENHDRWVNE